MSEQSEEPLEGQEEPQQAEGNGQSLGWAGLEQEEATRPGAALLGWLVNEAHHRNQSMKEMAQEVGVTYGYIRQLRSGQRQVQEISTRVIDGATRYLGVPRIAVMMAAGIVAPGDFYEQTDSWPHQVERALRYIADDPVWGSMLPAEVWIAGPELQQYCVTAYEVATGLTLLPGKVDLEATAAKYASGPKGSNGSGEGDAPFDPTEI